MLRSTTRLWDFECSGAIPCLAIGLKSCLVAILLFAGSLTTLPATSDIDPRGRQFMGFSSFTSFAVSSQPHALVLASPTLASSISFNEVIVSWNANLPPDANLVVEVRAVQPSTTRYFNLGVWAKSGNHPHSEAGQKDADGDVSTDTLILNRPATQLQVRLTLQNVEPSDVTALKFLGISLTDTRVSPAELAPRREVWGKQIPVIERTQMIYPNGKTLCSPTTVSMLMNYWAEMLKRPELDRSVPEIVDAIYDSTWHGAGNWAFNMAYAGSFPRMRAYVARFSDVSELEVWIERSIPVGLSLDYDRLRGKGPGPNGHLVVLVGFTKEGDPIINDPGTSEHVRKTFPRKNLIDAWACSRNTVYLVYPEDAITPQDLYGHWDSSRTH